MNQRPKKNRSSSARGGRGKGMERQMSVDGVYSNHRYMQCMGTIVGLNVTLQTQTKELFDGVLSTFSPDFNVVVDWPHPITPDGNTIRNPDTIKRKIIFPSKDIVLLKATNVDFDFATRDSFAVDATISKFNGQSSKEKELEPWHDGDAANSNVTLEDESANGWNADDMFKENEERYGVKSTYSSEMEEYTTPLPKKNTREYKEQEAYAQKIANEIEHSPIAQLRAEFENGDDEEAKFSAVTRPETSNVQGQTSGKYVLPQRRGKIQSGPANKPPPRGTPSPQSIPSNVGGSNMSVPSTKHSHSSSPVPPPSYGNCPPSNTSIPSASSTPPGGSSYTTANQSQQHKQTTSPHSMPSGSSGPSVDSSINGDTKETRRIEGSQMPLRDRDAPHHKEPYHSDYGHNQHHSIHHHPPQHSQSNYHHSSHYSSEIRRSEPREQREIRKYGSSYKEGQIAELKKFGKEFTFADNADKKPSPGQGGASHHQPSQGPVHHHPSHHQSSHQGSSMHHSQGPQSHHQHSQSSQQHYHSNQGPPPPSHRQPSPNTHIQQSQAGPSGGVHPVHHSSQPQQSTSQQPSQPMHGSMIPPKHHHPPPVQHSQSANQSIQQSQLQTTHPSGAISQQIHHQPSQPMHQKSLQPLRGHGQAQQTPQPQGAQPPMSHPPHPSHHQSHPQHGPQSQQNISQSQQVSTQSAQHGTQPLQQHSSQPPQSSQHSIQPPPASHHGAHPVQPHGSQGQQHPPHQIPPASKPLIRTPPDSQPIVAQNISTSSSSTTVSTPTTSQSTSTSQTSVTTTVESKPTSPPEDKMGSLVSNSTLNPKAKEFVFNPDADPFVPRSPSTTMTPPRPQTPQITPAQAPQVAATGPPVGFQQGMVQTYVIPTQPFQVQSQPRFKQRVPVGQQQRPDYTSSMQVAAATGHPILAPAPITPITTPQAIAAVQIPQNVMQQTGNPYPYPMMVRIPSFPGVPMTPTMMVPTTIGGMYHQGEGQQNTPSHTPQPMYMQPGLQHHHQHQHQHHHPTTPGPHPSQPPTPQGHNNHGPAPPNLPNQPPTPGPTPPQPLMYGNHGGAPMGAQPTIPQHIPGHSSHPAQSPHSQYPSHSPAVAAASSHSHPQIVMLPHLPTNIMPPPSGPPPHTPSSVSGFTPTSSGVHLNQAHLHYIPATNQGPHIPLMHHNQ